MVHLCMFVALCDIVVDIQCKNCEDPPCQKDSSGEQREVLTAAVIGPLGSREQRGFLQLL